ncbi:MAG: hypothetical protein ThorAB25_06160 [Candidatus Thorarchaeota archaeon AB_25]|nr:MAG: hypothetical protein ThorAB25_06160 [Candidatus Thorarchaeota archaeon AB_25]
MHVLEVGRKRFRLASTRVDRWLLRAGQKVARFLIDYRYLISVMIIGFIVWAIVFNIAVIDYLNTSRWVSRAAWLGPFPDPDIVEIFGFTVEYQIEGYSDYSFYYVHWGYNSLFGVMPYSPEYGVLEMNGITNENGAHMFPPFTSYLYAAGIALGKMMGWENWGIGFLIAAFGYLTALPVYGIARELSSNKRVGEVAALTYLLNPLMLYHTDFLWFNPAPFVFFFFAGFYMLVRGKRLTGTLLIVSAALFKQTAWFLGIPLVVYLLVRPRERKTTDDETPQPNGSQVVSEEKESSMQERVRSNLKPFIEYFDLRNFMISVMLVLIFVGAVMFPYLIAQPHFLDYWRLAMGSYSFEGNFVDPPPYNMPMRIQVLLILAEKPGYAELLDTILISGGLLGFGVVLCAGLMILKDKYVGEETLYLRRILFMTLIMMLIVTLLGPRGVFKYYFVMLMPFFSIFSSARMIRGSGEHVPFSASMVWVPMTLTLLILIPDRNIYLGFVILIFIGYLLAPLLDKLYHLAKLPFRFARQFIQRTTKTSLKPLTVEEQPFDVSRKRYFANIIIQSLLLGLGLFLIILGGWIAWMAIGVDIVTGLEVILVFSASFIVGFQILSLSLSFGLYTELRLTHLNKCLRDFTFLTVAILWIFGIWTYILSWPIELPIERQLLVISSTFISIWAGSLLLNQSNRTRILTDIMILGGLAINLSAWFSLANLTLILLGSIGLCSVLVHLLVLCVHTFDGRLLSPSTYKPESKHAEEGVEHPL